VGSQQLRLDNLLLVYLGAIFRKEANLWRSASLKIGLNVPGWRRSSAEAFDRGPSFANVSKWQHAMPPTTLAPAQAYTPFIINADQSHHKYRTVGELHFSISKFPHSVFHHLHRRLGGFMMPLVHDICQ
jgi:hypothetical protein